MVWKDNDPECQLAWHPGHVCTNERGWPSNGGPCQADIRAMIREQKCPNKEAKDEQ